MPSLFSNVHNNPLIYADPTGYWCESADGYWSHPGACDSSTSTNSDDMLHDGDLIKMGKNFIGPLQAYSYPIEYRYARWKAGDVAAFEGASNSVRQQLAYMAKSDWTWTDAVKWFSAGALTGEVLASPASGLLAMEVATTGTFTYNATTLAGGTTAILKILSCSKAVSKVPAMNKIALKSLEVNRPITGIIRSDGTIEAHVQNVGYTISHRSLGLTKADTHFNMLFYDGKWYVTGFGYASGQGWNMPSAAQQEMILTLFGVK